MFDLLFWNPDIRTDNIPYIVSSARTVTYLCDLEKVAVPRLPYTPKSRVIFHM